MWLIGLVLTGLIIGALGRLALPGRQEIGILGTIAAGVIGSMIGAVIAAIVPFFDHRELSGLVFNVAGAVIALYAWERIAGTGERRRALGRG